MTPHRFPARRLGGDAGTIAPLVPVMALVLLLLGGLIVDASRLLNARGRAVAYAEEAARAGASAILPGQAELELQPRLVEERVDAYCRAIELDATQNLGSDGADGVVECRQVPPLRRVADDDPRELVVVVFVKVTIPASLLGIVGVTELTASGEGRARPYEGVDAEDVDSSPPPVEVYDPEGPSGPPPDVDVGVPLPQPTPTPTPTPSATPGASPDPSAGASPAPEPSPTGPPAGTPAASASPAAGADG